MVFRILYSISFTNMLDKLILKHEIGVTKRFIIHYKTFPNQQSIFVTLFSRKKNKDKQNKQMITKHL